VALVAVFGLFSKIFPDEFDMETFAKWPSKRHHRHPELTGWRHKRSKLLQRGKVFKEGDGEVRHF
jgi:hypothetical protein